MRDLTEAVVMWPVKDLRTSQSVCFGWSSVLLDIFD